MDAQKKERFCEAVLERVKYRVLNIINPDSLSLGLLESQLPMIYGDDLAMAITAEFLAKHVSDDVLESVTYPRDWWQAFKERWLPRFILERWPVNYKTNVVTVKRYRLCPHINIPTTRQQTDVHIWWLIEGNGS